MLDASLKEQVRSIFSGLKADYMFDMEVAPQHESRGELVELLGEVASCSDRIACRERPGEGLRFSLLRNGEPTGISFRAVPTGHEFSSLLLAVLNADGQGKNFPDRSVCDRVRALNGPIRLTTYVSLTVDGAIHQAEVAALNVQGVPSVFADGELLHVGRGDFGELLAKLEARYGIDAAGIEAVERRFDVVVLGGGPAGVSAAIYSARKGLSVALVAERIGGQVNETVGIENLISVPETTGRELVGRLAEHLGRYPVEVFEHRRASKVEVADGLKSVATATGERFVAPALIVATGARWRRLNVPGEREYTGRGVAFCPHCDGPFYKDRPVAVVGGGNSGVEAAIDLAGICSHVTVLEFMDSLKADVVLQDKLRSLPNVVVFTSVQTTSVEGDGSKVTAVRLKDRASGEERTIPLDGVFVQIGLSANSDLFDDLLERNRAGEIVIDDYCRTGIPGVYAAGDVSTVPYKQIVVAMGEGAKAALSAFDDRVRGVIG